MTFVVRASGTRIKVVSTLLAAVGLASFLAGLPALVAPSLVRDAVPPAYADSVGDRRNCRGFGAGLVSVGISNLVIVNGVAA